MQPDPKELADAFAAEEIGKLRTETIDLATGRFVHLSYDSIEAIMKYCYIMGISKGIDLMADGVQEVMKKR